MVDCGYGTRPYFRERVNTMGYYQNIEVAIQDDVTRYEAWYQSVGHTLDDVAWAWLHESAERVWKAIELWEEAPYQAKRAVDHVALQPVTRRQALAAERVKSDKTRDYDRIVAVAAVTFLGLSALTLLVVGGL